jgi:para-nitrobenzyl esterase
MEDQQSNVTSEQTSDTSTKHRRDNITEKRFQDRKRPLIYKKCSRLLVRQCTWERISKISSINTPNQCGAFGSLKSAQHAAPVFNYWFTWQTPVLDGRPGAFHCSEIAFVFDNTDRCAPMTGGGPGPRALAAQVSDAWINFARHGDPNHSGVPHWPAFTAEQCPTMIFNTQFVMKNNPDTDERKVITL